MRYAICRILGDGQPPDGYYAAIRDVLIPGAGIQAYHYTQQIGFGAGGELLHPWVMVAANLVPGATWRLLEGNADVDLLPDYPLDAPASAIHLPTRDAMTAAMQARGIDTAFIGAADGFRDVLNYLGRMHEPLFNIDEYVP